ncbi:hypothetical protein [Vibrio sp. SCSIO 43155]|uniref:hypothetical protein n=1 Tax=Vibrio sp. SCSIO 43155 TaxID=2819099 RepID=UPI002074B750|nr:hypothetical protein [Vibrio sp. SCSIO 43155]USD58631.1 hypothetical protein J4N44_27140 [Vibrio sp. SCSIO 43155]
MRYYLVTSHRYPKFYDLAGSIIEVELNYVDTKTISEINDSGELVHHSFGGTPPVVNGVWMVDSVEKAYSELSRRGIYPFASKVAAKEHAKRLDLKTFKYLPVAIC